MMTGTDLLIPRKKECLFQIIKFGASIVAMAALCSVASHVQLLFTRSVVQPFDDRIPVAPIIGAVYASSQSQKWVGCCIRVNHVQMPTARIVSLDKKKAFVSLGSAIDLRRLVFIPPNMLHTFIVPNFARNMPSKYGSGVPIPVLRVGRYHLRLMYRLNFN